MKTLAVSNYNHTKILEIKLQQKLKSVDDVLTKLLEDAEWTA
jgi:hypothetical protein